MIAVLCNVCTHVKEVKSGKVLPWVPQLLGAGRIFNPHTKGLSMPAVFTDSLECTDTHPTPSANLDSTPPSLKQWVNNILQSRSQLYVFNLNFILFCWVMYAEDQAHSHISLLALHNFFQNTLKEKKYMVVSKLLRVKNTDNVSCKLAAGIELKFRRPYAFLFR